MNSLDERLEKILERVDSEQFGLPEEAYRDLWLEDLKGLEKMGAPASFVAFLKRYGVGELAPFFYITSRLVPAQEYLGRDDPRLGSLLVFGSDLGEQVYAFDPEDGWSVKAVDIEDLTIEPQGDFPTFLFRVVEEITQASL